MSVLNSAYRSELPEPHSTFLMGRLSEVHWVAPASMLGAFSGGVGLAAGHHFFYQSLDGSIATDASYSIFGSNVSTQEANIAIGTALAFLVKACLVYATCVAFLQFFWKEATAVNGRKPAKLMTLDSLYSSLGNIFTLLNLPLWWRYPFLLCIAATAWYALSVV